MKRILYVWLVIVAFIIQSCGGGAKTPSIEKEVEKPLNITVFVDLSDRLIHQGEPTQIEKDTAIVGHIAEYFLNKTRESEEGLQECKNAIQVLFYPTPKTAAMVKCADELIVDIQKCQAGKFRRDKVLGIKDAFEKNLEQIYIQAINDNDWPGCDIWGFFSYKKVDDLCIRSGYRNIMFILTDGYVYDEGTKEIHGDTSTYILPKILNNPNAALKVVRNRGLEDMEIAIMEIQPENPKHLPKMKSMLETWFKDMGVKAEHITIAETGMPATTRRYIDNILN